MKRICAVILCISLIFSTIHIVAAASETTLGVSSWNVTRDYIVVELATGEEVTATIGGSAAEVTYLNEDKSIVKITPADEFKFSRIYTFKLTDSATGSKSFEKSFKLNSFLDDDFSTTDGNWQNATVNTSAKTLTVSGAVNAYPANLSMADIKDYVVDVDINSSTSSTSRMLFRKYTSDNTPSDALTYVVRDFAGNYVGAVAQKGYETSFLLYLTDYMTGASGSEYALQNMGYMKRIGGVNPWANGANAKFYEKDGSMIMDLNGEQLFKVSSVVSPATSTGGGFSISNWADNYTTVLDRISVYTFQEVDAQNMPVVSNLAITKEGENTLKVSYDLSKPEGNSVYNWYYKNAGSDTWNLIVGENTKVLDISGYTNSMFKFSVVPVSEDRIYGQEESIEYIPELMPYADGLNMSKDGDVLTAEYIFHDYNGDSEDTENTIIKWYSSSFDDVGYELIENVTGKTVTVTDEMLGKYIKFSVTPKSVNEPYFGTEVMSDRFLYISPYIDAVSGT